MASSQAACINLFMPILMKKEIAEEVLPLINPMFDQLAVDHLENGFQFEYWDVRNPLGDHTPAAGTDSDVAIAYYDINGKLCLWLIEHKSTENEFTTCGGFGSYKNKRKELCRDAKLIVKDNSNCYYKYKSGYKYWEITNRSDLYEMDVLMSRKVCSFKGAPISSGEIN